VKGIVMKVSMWKTRFDPQHWSRVVRRLTLPVEALLLVVEVVRLLQLAA